MAVALRGNLEDFGIADVFQLVGQQRKTGVLEFTDLDGRRVQLRFDQGAIVSAAPFDARAHASLGDMLVRCGCLTRPQVDALHQECEPSGQSLPRLAVARGAASQTEIDQIEALLTRETIFDVLRWSNGSFDFRTQPVEHRHEFETLLRAEQILMDGLRMVDEWQSFADRVPGEDAVFERTGTFDDYRNQVTESGSRFIDDAAKIFALVDGRLPVRRIIDLSRLGSFDGTRALAALRDAGVIALMDPGAVRKLGRRSRARVLPQANVRDWAATLIPLLLLVAVVFSIASRSLSSGDSAAVPIPPSEVALVRDDFAALRVQHAIEEYRFARGAWPAQLGQLQERGILGAEELASEEGRPYYYAVRAEGAVLLAPER